MREILFRGKRKDTGDWVKGFVWKGADITIIIPSGTGIGYNSKRCAMSATAYEVIPETVGQFIGILDYDDRLIFEGDIVKGSNIYGLTVNAAKVVYVEDEAAFKANNYFVDEILYLEKVGNVYDNPELLEEGKK